MVGNEKMLKDSYYDRLAVSEFFKGSFLTIEQVKRTNSLGYYFAGWGGPLNLYYHDGVNSSPDYGPFHNWQEIELFLVNVVMNDQVSMDKYKIERS